MNEPRRRPLDRRQRPRRHQRAARPSLAQRRQCEHARLCRRDGAAGRASPPPARAWAWSPARRSAISTRRCRPRCLQQNASTAALTTTTGAMSAIDAAQGHAGPGPGHRQLARPAAGPVLDSAQRPLERHAASRPSSAPPRRSTGGLNRLSDATTRRSARRRRTRSSPRSGRSTPRSGRSASLSDKIMAAKAAGQSTADLDNQRDAQIGESVAAGRRSPPSASQRRRAADHAERACCCQPRGPESALHQRRQRAAGRHLSGRRPRRHHDRRAWT